MKVINFLGGPCSGKSTLCAGLFYEMKKALYNVEFVHEWAKELTWDERFKCLTDQVSILGHQNNMVKRLDGKVDWVVTDTCIVMGLMYMPQNYYENFEPLMLEVFNSYDNVNVFVDRPDNYTEVGRNQTLEEARAIDDRILDLLENHRVPYMRVHCSTNPAFLLQQILTENE
jgi:tRNA uridine 5-carbamoylmethylation protein Kti12